MENWVGHTASPTLPDHQKQVYVGSRPREGGRPPSRSPTPGPPLRRRRRNLHDAGGLNPSAAARAAACDWVRASRARWESWIPARCAPGQRADSDLDDCDPCPAGSFCSGGVEPDRPCPANAYCPIGASAPVPCPEGRATASDGGAEGECSLCRGGYRALGGGCFTEQVLAAAARAAFSRRTDAPRRAPAGAVAMLRLLHRLPATATVPHVNRTRSLARSS